MNPIVFAIPVFMAFVGLEAWLAWRRGLKVYRLHDALTSINIGAMSETIRALLKLLSLAVYAVVVERVGAFSWDLKSPWVWVLAFFMYDFFYYWAHRSGHEVNLLWAAHVVHHSSEDYNLSTALRQSSTNQVFYWLFYLPMAIVGIPVTVFVVIALISVVYQFWSHTQLVGKLGWADRVFVTPSNHRCHHGRNDYCLDKNYGGTLIIWDRLFGTYVAERDDEPVVYGTLVPLQSWNPLWGNLKNYVGIWRQVRSTAGWSNKLMRVFAPPGWGNADAPAPALPQAASWSRFDTPALKWQHVYGLLASAVIFGLLFNLLIVAQSLSVPQRAAYAAVLVLNAVGMAWVFEGKRWALGFEALRAALVFGALAAGLWFGPVSLPAQVAALFALALSWGMLALARGERAKLGLPLAGVAA
jgi:sterol desaturase/sphingolipid hydroxylase (fatty acid hydroxylase superfamily)